MNRYISTVETFIAKRTRLLLGVIIAAWSAYMIFIKLYLLHKGLATDDLFNYYNSLINTNFYDQWLYLARYELAFNWKSNLYNHWQPSILVLWPFAKFGGPETLLVIQALAPAWAALFLYAIAERIGLAPFDTFFVVIVSLFHPNSMAAVMDSLYGFHGTTLMLYFGAPMVWAAITGRWRLALAMLLFFLNVRENTAFYIGGAAVGFLLLGNAYFDTRRRMFIALGITSVIFVFAVFVVPKLAGVTHVHAQQTIGAVTTPDLLLRHLRNIDPDWHNLYLWMWPGFAALGSLMTIIPESAILMAVQKKASHWYGMTLVFAGSIAVAYGLLRIRRFGDARGKSGVLTFVLILHMLAIVVAGPKEVRDQTRKLVTRIGVDIPMSARLEARRAIDENCRVSVDLQGMYGFGDLRYLQYPSQAAVSKYLVVVPSMPSGMTKWVEANQTKLKLIFENEHLKVFENPQRPCV